MAKRSNDMPLSEAIQQMLRSYQLADRVQLADLVANWETLFGKTMAKYSKPTFIKNGDLKIHVTQAPLKMQLQYNRDKIVKIINEHFKTEVVKSVSIL
jgi:predicted nucleic acid-binding Zn ribbon protein